MVDVLTVPPKAGTGCHSPPVGQTDHWKHARELCEPVFYLDLFGE